MNVLRRAEVLRLDPDPAPAAPPAEGCRGATEPDGDDGHDRELVARVRAGDATAFEIVFRAYYESLCAFVAPQLRSRTLAEEVVQDILCRIWEQRHEWDVRGRLATYLYAAARHRVINYRKHDDVVQRATAAAVREDRAVAMGQGPPAPDVPVRTEQLMHAVERVLATLPERCRLAYVLRWRHQLTDAEVARVMGISVKGVEYQVARALRTLRKELAGFF